MANLLTTGTLFWLTACGADPTTIEGALARAASAVGARDHEALYAVIDQRSRFALASIYQARRHAAEEVRASYPVALQAGALAELGDAVEAKSDADLFRLRCDDACLDGFAAQLGAPREIATRDGLSHVKTVRGTETELYRGNDGRYGLVWETAALVRERTRAAAELELIRKNGEQYRAQRALQGAKP